MQKQISETTRLTLKQIEKEQHRIQAMRENLKRRKAFQKAMDLKSQDNILRTIQDTPEGEE